MLLLRFLLLSHSGSGPAPVKPTESRKVWFSTGISFAAISSLYQLLGQTDILTLGILDTDSSVGVYAVCISLASLIVFTQKAVELIAGPLLAERHASGEKVKFELTILGTTVGGAPGTLAEASILSPSGLADSK